MKKSRQSNSILNSGTILICRFFQMLLSFIVRSFLIKYLGEEVLGLDGLFSSVLSVLSLADLGINTAIVYSLYVPIANGDQPKVAAYVAFFKKFYCMVGITILCVGVAITPFLHCFVNLPNDVDNINLYYLLAVVGTSITYFVSSRRVIFEADQRYRNVTIIDTFFNMLLQILQIALMWLLGNYMYVLALRVVMSFANNLVIYFWGERCYPFLGTYKASKLNKQEKIKLRKDVMAVMCHKIGAVFVTGTDSLIISTFVNTIMAGYYSNYFTIINSISVFVTTSIGALTPSIGNLKAESNDLNHHYSVFKEVVLLNFVMSAFCASSLFCLLNPFIELWIGEKFTFNLAVVIVLCVNFYISSMRFGVGAFGTAAGLFKETVIKPILEGVINIVVSMFLVRIYGIIGVFIGTTASLILGSVWVDPYFLFKKWFNKPVKNYFATYGLMFVYTVFVSAIVKIVIFHIPGTGIMGFIYKALVVVGLNLLLLTVGARAFPGYVNLRKRICSIFRKILRR